MRKNASFNADKGRQNVHAAKSNGNSRFVKNGNENNKGNGGFDGKKKKKTIRNVHKKKKQ